MNTSFNEWLKINEKWDIIAPNTPIPKDTDEDDDPWEDWDDEDAWEDEERRLRRGQGLTGARTPVSDLGVSRGRTLGRMSRLPSGMHVVDPDREELQNARQYLGAEYYRLRNKLEKGIATPEEKHLLRTLARKHIEGIYHHKKPATVSKFTSF